MDDRPKQNTPRVSGFKTRKSEIISGISLACLLGLYGAFRNLMGDINELIETKARITEARITRVEEAFKDLLALERDTRKEDTQELKQRIVWIEREIGTFRKK